MVNTLPLFQHPPLADAWHNVTAPGGYEWWYFDAEDVERDRQIVAMLFDGCALHPEYVRRYASYAKNPTRVTPPRPREFICAYFAVYHAGRIEQQFMSQYPVEHFEARREERHVQVGPNQFKADSDALKLWLGGTPSRSAARGAELTATFSFRSRFTHAAGEHQLFARHFAGASHRWIVADPLCEVVGEIVLTGSKIPFHGRGYHDHYFGTGPIAPGIRQWFRGRLLLNDHCWAFHVARADKAEIDSEVHLLEIDPSGAREVAIDLAQVEMVWSQKSEAWLRYPSLARFGDVLRFTDPRVIDSSPFRLRISYEAAVRGEFAGRALCEVVYPRRLHVPILGRMIERSIDQRALAPRR